MKQFSKQFLIRSNCGWSFSIEFQNTVDENRLVQSFAAFLGSIKLFIFTDTSKRNGKSVYGCLIEFLFIQLFANTPFTSNEHISYWRKYSVFILLCRSGALLGNIKQFSIHLYALFSSIYR